MVFSWKRIFLSTYKFIEKVHMLYRQAIFLQIQNFLNANPKLNGMHSPVCFRDKTNECQFKGKRNLVDKNWGETAINEMPNEEVFDIAMLIIFCFKFIKYVFSRVHEEGGQLKDSPCICKQYQASASSRPK